MEITRRKEGEYDVWRADFSKGNLKSIEVRRKGNAAEAFRNYLSNYLDTTDVHKYFV